MKIDRRTLLGAAAGFGLMGLGARPACADPVEDIFPVADTTEGKIRGLQAGAIRMFKGVRYGASTAGAGRFMAPKPPPKWKGIKDAFAYGNYAPQMPNSRALAYSGLIEFDIQPGGMGEDCLVLNIWTPTLERSAKLPVMVHIHGGGYYGGSGNSPGYDGESLARFGHALVITLNHRLGAFGYLDLMDEGAPFASSGAAGMLDLVQALQWVKANAENFGGDPTRVLVFGQSGGGAKTSVLMAMPAAKGYFHRAGVMSGAVLKLPTRDEAAKISAQLLKALGLGKGQALKLQQMPFEQVLAAQAGLEGADRAKGEAPRSFSPFLDGAAIPRHPFDPDAPAISADIPMISSTVLDERAYRLSNYDLEEAGFRKFARDRLGAEGDKLADMYRQEDPKASPFVLEARLDTDSGFRRSAIIQTERKAAAGKAKVWSYLYRMQAPAYDGRYGAPHGSDVGPSLHEVRGGLNGPGPESLILADQMASAWVSFAATGDPNNPKTPNWPAYTLEKRTTMVFNGGRMSSPGAVPVIYDSVAVDDPRKAFREFWAKHPPGA